MPRKPLAKDVLLTAGCGAVTFGLAWLAIAFSRNNGGAASVWPVNAVILTLLLSQPSRSWPRLALAAFIGNVAAGLTFGGAWPGPVGLAVCNSLELLTGALVLRRFVGSEVDLSRRRDLIVFGAVCLLAPLAPAVLSSVLMVMLGRDSASHAFLLWFLADTLSLVIVAPALLAARAADLKVLIAPGQRGRTVGLLAIELAIIAAVCLWDTMGLKAVIFAALMIPAFTLGVTGAAIGVLLGAVVVLGFAVAGPQFAHLAVAELQQQVTVLQVFIAISGAAALALASTLEGRRKAEARLAESEARYRLLADRATDIILQTDQAGTILYVSPSCRHLGFSEDEMVGRSALEFLHADAREMGMERTRELFEGGARPESDRRAYHTLCKDGSEVWLEGHSSLIHDDNGVAVGAVSHLRDITARRAMEAEIERKRADAEAAVVAKSEFLANMSHEIRTPLTGIIGFAGLLAEQGDLSPTAAKFTNRIVTASQTLLSVVNDVLDFSKIEAGHVVLDPQPFDPGAFVVETLELAGSQAAAKGLTLKSEVRGALPAAVLADSSRIRQVLLNLIANAIKFTAHGGVSVSVSYLEADGGSLRVEVTDTGVGIAPDRLGLLFRRFSQVDGSISRTYGGSGLGLVICKSLAEMMGGSIGVESVEGAGSTFWFTIAAPPAALAAPAFADEGAAVWSGPAPRILIVDDVAVNRELVRVMLAQFGHDLTEAASGLEALDAAMHQSFDLILMDLQMPGMDGLAATRAIRATSELNRTTPIVAFSANVMATHLESCREAGMDDHIAKPIDPVELLTKVSQWASADRASRQDGVKPGPRKRAKRRGG